MVVQLSEETMRLLETRMKEGGFANAEDVILAGLHSLGPAEACDDFAPGELDALIEEADESIRNHGTYSHEEVFGELRARLAEKRSAG